MTDSSGPWVSDVGSIFCRRSDGTKWKIVLRARPLNPKTGRMRTLDGERMIVLQQVGSAHPLDPICCTFDTLVAHFETAKADLSNCQS